jgi:peptidoglycan/LPS O-acetylase OafA/YrhL
MISTDRVHGLDALRAFALLLGIVLHSALPYILPPGAWAVGTTQPNLFLAWVVYYLHSFRLEVFFLMAGFFAALVVGRRGAAAFVRDRARRILLVFVVALYPMKLALGAVWIAGGLRTGWLAQVLPQEAATPAWHMLGLELLARERWPDTSLTHLWFLYYLAWISGLFIAARSAAQRTQRSTAATDRLDAACRRIVGSRVGPLLLAGLVTPILAMMAGTDIDTPDHSFELSLPVTILYFVFFSLGWWLYRTSDLLTVFAGRWWQLLVTGLVVSLAASAGVGMRIAGGPWVAEHAAGMRWATSLGTSLTMMLSLFGWLGCFVRFFNRPSAPVRYVADASYWIYVTHLPVVVALQVWWVHSGLPWWIQVPLVNVVAFLILLASYHVCVRFTWVGAWLNNRKWPRSAQAVAQS